MTNFEKLIKTVVETTALTTISQATEQVAEGMAREILKDPAFRADMQTLIRRHFGQTMTTLARNGRKRRSRR